MEKQKTDIELTPVNKKLLIASLIVFFAGWVLGEPTNATFGYHAISLLIPLISYSVTLYVLSAIITGIIGKFRTHSLKVFLWLFLSASIFQLFTSLFRVIVTYLII